MTEMVVVGMADGAVSTNPEAVIVTHALGSCIAVCMHDPVARIGGLFHYMLPLSVVDPRNVGDRPFMYCDSGLPLLMRRMVDAGADGKRLVVCAAGGANVVDDNGFFNIGKKNEQILRRLLAANKIALKTQEFGGRASRTVGLDVASGHFWIKQWAPR